MSTTISAGVAKANSAITGAEKVPVSGASTPTLTTRQIAALAGKVYNVENYGALHDYQTVTTASINSGTAILNLSSGAFVAGDVGKTIRVFGAGAAGIDLITTILSYQSATQVTLNTNASTTIASAGEIEWGTDDTSYIQSAINACFTDGGGTVYLPNGIYLIAGALQTSINVTNPNTQIYIPVTDGQVSPSTIPTIELRGESIPSMYFDHLSLTTTLPKTGAILKSIIVGSGTYPSVIGSPWTSTSTSYFAGFNFTFFKIRNITIRTKTKVGITHVAGTMSGLNFTHLWAVEAKDIRVDTESRLSNQSVLPTSTNSVGVKMPQNNNSGTATIEDVLIQDYYTGIVCDENTHGEKLFVGGNLYNYDLGNGSGGYYPIVLGRVFSHASPNNYKMNGSLAVSIRDAFIERLTTGTVTPDPWYLWANDFTQTTGTATVFVDNFTAVQAALGNVVAQAIPNKRLFIRNDQFNAGGVTNFQALGAGPGISYTNSAIDASASSSQSTFFINVTGANTNATVTSSAIQLSNGRTGTTNVNLLITGNVTGAAAGKNKAFNFTCGSNANELTWSDLASYSGGGLTLGPAITGASTMGPMSINANYGNGGDLDINSYFSGTSQFSLQFSNAGSFEGTVNTNGGRTVGLYDRVSSTFTYGVSANFFTIGNSTANFGLLSYRITSGTGITIFGSSGTFKGVGIGQTSPAANLHITQLALSSAWQPTFKTDPGAHTSLTASTAFPNQVFSTATQSWVAAAGTITAQKDTEFRAITHSAATSGTITDLYNVYFEDPLVGGSMTATRKWSIGAQGNVNVVNNLVMGTAALATNATDGFLHISSSAGAPSGTPTTYTGRVPIHVDTTNNFLYLYIGGAWKKSTVYA